MRIHDTSKVGAISAPGELREIDSVPKRLSAALMRTLWHGVRLIVWLAYFVLFYQSGLALTKWLVEPPGTLDAVGVGMARAFPIIVASFPRVNRLFLRTGASWGEGRCGL